MQTFLPEVLKVMPQERTSTRDLEPVVELPVGPTGDESVEVGGTRQLPLEVVSVMPQERISRVLGSGSCVLPFFLWKEARPGTVVSGRSCGRKWSCEVFFSCSHP